MCSFLISLTTSDEQSQKCFFDNQNILSTSFNNNIYLSGFDMGKNLDLSYYLLNIFDDI